MGRTRGGVRFFWYDHHRQNHPGANRPLLRSRGDRVYEGMRLSCSRRERSCRLRSRSSGALDDAARRWLCEELSLLLVHASCVWCDEEEEIARVKSESGRG